jgi:uncharacterized protein
MTKYRRRTYRHAISRTELDAYEVRVKETDLLIRGDRKFADRARDVVLLIRGQIESYIEQHPDFMASLIPIEDDLYAPSIVRDMILAGRKAGVGPMAAVAGAVAERVGRELLVQDDEILVENGGDIFAKVNRTFKIGIFAGRSPLSNKLALVVRPEDTPLGICTSSGTVGHSLSKGRADVACVLSKSTALADAAATALGNRVKSRKDVENALAWSENIPEITGALIIIEDRVGARGNVQLLRA